MLDLALDPLQKHRPGLLLVQTADLEEGALLVGDHLLELGLLGLEGLFELRHALVVRLDRLFLAVQRLHLGFEGVFLLRDKPLPLAQLFTGLGGLLLEGLPGLDGLFLGGDTGFLEEASCVLTGFGKKFLGLRLGLARTLGEKRLGNCVADGQTNGRRHNCPDHHGQPHERRTSVDDRARFQTNERRQPARLKHEKNHGVGSLSGEYKTAANKDEPAALRRAGTRVAEKPKG